MSTVAALRAARAKIDDPKRWTQGADARDDQGDPIDPASPYAVCWCASGAILTTWGYRKPASFFLGRAMGVDTVYLFNDTHSHAEVLAAFDEAIALAESRAEA